MIAENTAKYAGGMAPSKRYADLVYPAPVETRSAGEIIDNICAKLDAMGKEARAFGCI
jgi:hypothetical protein|nr:MAG TPA: hypothetical protein [Caudoviricetes sp.]